MFKTILLVFAVGIGLGACEAEPYHDPEAFLLRQIVKGWEGDPEAIQYVLACLENSPAYERKTWADYYWLLALERAGIDVGDGRLEAAKMAINPEDVWMVEEWHLDPESYPPFTSIEFIEC